jgi:hypothetical protein
MDNELLKKYGLPTALACALLVALLWVVRILVMDIATSVRTLADDVDFLSGIVDSSCQPIKERPKKKPSHGKEEG